jgi:hypothetical protein
VDTKRKDYPVLTMEEKDGKKPKRKVRRFTPDFKASAVRLALDEGPPCWAHRERALAKFARALPFCGRQGQLTTALVADIRNSLRYA